MRTADVEGRPEGVAYLCAQPRRDGTVAYHWKPSPRLRRMGWSNLFLGTDYEAAAAAAAARNEEIAASGAVALLRKRMIRIERHRKWVDRKLLSLREQLAEAKGGIGKIYFIATLKGPIKIGFSFDPPERLRYLQTGHSQELRILATVDGTPATEAAYHARFAAHRLRGEWFAAHADILDEIRRLKGPKSSHAPSHRRTATGSGAGNRRTKRLDRRKSAII